MTPMTRTVVRATTKLSNQIRRKLDAFSSKDTFSGAQGRILHFLLAQHDAVFQKDIEEEFSLRPPTATQQLKKMEQNGLIRREATSYDGRLKRIIATKKALQYQDEVMSDLQNLEEQITNGISSQDLQTFFEVTEKMMRNLS